MRLEEAVRLQEDLVKRLVAPLLQPALGGAHAYAVGVPSRRHREVTPTFRGIALGVAPATGESFKLAVRVQRGDLFYGDELKQIVAAAEGEVDIRYIGRVRTLAAPPTQDRTRPLRIGVSLAQHEVAAGTLGCFVRGADGEVEVLSNNHVLADENRATVGDVVLQPGSWDGGKESRDIVGHLKRVIPLHFAAVNRLDCATAHLAPGIGYEPTALLDGGSLDSVPLVPRQGMLVEKIGRTTGRTVGRLSGLNVSVLGVEYNSADNVRFDGQLEIEDVGAAPFSAEGDSGSVVFTQESKRPIGLLFSGSDAAMPGQPGVTYANPLTEVLDALQVTLVA